MPDPLTPNIVVLMTDQQRVGCTAGEGGPDTMPRLDALLTDACRFERAYTPSPVCVPARTSLLTGRFPTAHRVRQNSTAQHALFESDLLDVLRGAGYSLHFSGKPHMHPGPEDFDSYHGPYFHDSGPERTREHEAFDRWLRALDHGVAEEPTPFPLSAQFPHRIIDGALEALTGTGEEEPFFLWVSFPEPHNPYQVPEPYFSMFEDQVPGRIADADDLAELDWRFRWLRDLFEQKRPGYDAQWRRYRANYLGMLRLIDDQVGRLLDALGDRAEETLFLVLSDHGDFLGDYGLQRKGAGMPEALMRVPLSVAGPGVAAQRRQEPVSLVDVMPTLAEWTTGELPPGAQGRSLAPLLRGEAAPPEEFSSMLGELGYGGISYDERSRPPLHFPYEGRTVDELNSVTLGGEMRMVVTERLKLVVDDRGVHRLFDLETDPAELHDLSEDPARRDDLAAMQRLLLRWMMRTADDLPRGAYIPRTRNHNWRWAQPIAP
ncbi:sulfatase-like hydrolase/transferase [Brachybacterium sp.]|uniref:sulfatase-like hydrolase/transferase n=1 Tax=Brachybacterium sp. TaxID=1891286 RepID=UPI002ED31CAE